jgi:hypothetical protein
VKQSTLVSMLVIFAATGIGILLLSSGTVSAQDPKNVVLYNPYPPGVLPADLVSEIARVPA